MCFSLLITWTYSAKPLKFKERPGIDLLIHGIFVLTYPYFVTMVLTKTRFQTLDWLVLGIAFLGPISVQLEQQIRDYEVDRLSSNNFTVRFGIPRSQLIIKIIGIIIAGIVIFTVINIKLPMFIYAFLIICSPLIIMKVRQESRRSEKLVAILLSVGFVLADGIYWSIFYFRL